MSLTPSTGEIEIIYERYVDTVYGYFFKRMGTQAVAEDLTSDTFLRFVDQYKKGAMEHPEKYLYGIAKNVLNDYLRRKYRFSPIPLGDDVDAAADENDDFMKPQKNSVSSRDKQSQRVVSCLPDIPVKQADVIRLILVDRLSLSEVARKLGKNINYVKTTKKRAVKSLRRVLECTP